MSFDDEFEKMKSGKCPFVVGTLPWRYYKKVKKFEQLSLFGDSL